ncbi:TPA: hypothetical protein NJZ01_004594 [Vibrio parahaemolyticus]|nr:hypothetical protein [Vibrio parahaemolyticus]
MSGVRLYHNKRLHRTNFRCHLLCTDSTKAAIKNLLGEPGVIFIGEMEMFFRKIFFTLGLIGLIGCSSNPNYYEPSCNPGSPLCLGLAIVKSVENSSSSKKCSDMSGEKRRACEKQVESLKKHIKNASRK